MRVEHRFVKVKDWGGNGQNMVMGKRLHARASSMLFQAPTATPSL
jgi:hypothetical protein